jgi:hypothetical protein
MKPVASRLAPVVLLSFSLLGVVVTTGPAAAAEPPHFEFLPPDQPWNEATRDLMVPADDPWATPFEVSGGVDSPTYDETVAWLRKLVAASPKLRMTSLGKSPQGRDVWLVIASATGASTPEELRQTGKPVLFAQAGIHPGEIDGKDAGMMLLRDMTVGGSESDLLGRASFLFIPILSVDGHERRSPYGRINQRGPENTGWRTNARNLNLNRDYAKLDIPEMRHLIAALERWQPDLYLDLHVTDGEDYRYDVTFGWTGPHGWSPSIARWLDGTFRPAVSAALEARGHVPGPLIFGVDRLDIRKGIADWTAPPRFSNGYGDARHLPTVLVENHSLKRFDRRVLGTYVFLEGCLDLLGREAGNLRRAVAEDRARHPEELPLAFGPPQTPPETLEFLGVEHRVAPSSVSGGLAVEWLGTPVTFDAPLIAFTEPTATASRPRAYWIPPSWSDVIGRLRLHGVRMEETSDWREVEVEMYRLTGPELADMPFEGHVQVTATPVAETRTERFPPGSVRIPTDQPLGDLAMLLLEPASPDSFFQWGFFHAVLSRTEYVEGYVMEKMATRMLEEDEELRSRFLERLATDDEFRADPQARLMWFYEQTPYYDQRYLLYPVARER